VSDLIVANSIYNFEYGDTLQIPLFTHNCDNGIKVSQNNQALDTWTLLQISQNFRASDKYSFDKLEISLTLRITGYKKQSEEPAALFYFPSANSTAFSAWIAVVSNSFTLVSFWFTNIPISVQPRITASAPLLASKSMIRRYSAFEPG